MVTAMTGASARAAVRVLLPLLALLALLLAAEGAPVASASADAAAAGPRYILFVLREDCWATFFERFDLLNLDCLKASISKGLGLGIILGAVVVKLPQIHTIMCASFCLC